MHTDTAALGERYEILEELGRKGVSMVYRGYDRTEGREVVLKRVAPNSEDRGKYTEKDLVEDAIALSSVKNPNFLTIYDYGKDEKGPFVVAEALQGVILEGTLKKSVLSVEDFISLVKQTLESLIAAHEAGLTGVHLDPWNIMLLRQAGGRYRLKILGLGRSAANALPILETEYTLGQGTRQANPWAEFLSLGRLYYQALTGFRPFGNEESLLVQGSPAMEKLVPCHGRCPDVPKELCDWVMWLIAAADLEPGLTAERVLERFLAMCAAFEDAPSAAREDAAAAATRRAEAIVKSHAMDEAHEVYAEYVERRLKAQSAAEREFASAPVAVEPAAAAANSARARQTGIPSRPLPQSRREAQPQPQPQIQPLPSPARPAPETEIVNAPPVASAQPAQPAPKGGVPKSEPKAAPEAVGIDDGAKVTDDANDRTRERSGKSSRRKHRRRTAAKKKKKSAAEMADAPAETTRPSGVGIRSGPPLARPARPGEVPLANGGRFRKIESHGVFLPAPVDAVFPEDLNRPAGKEPAANPAEEAKMPRRGEVPPVIENVPGKAPEAKPGRVESGDTEIPDIVLPENDFPAARLYGVDSKSAAPGSISESVPMPEFAWLRARRDADPRGADAAEPAPAGLGMGFGMGLGLGLSTATSTGTGTGIGAGAGSWRVLIAVLAVLLCVSIIVLAGVLTKSNSRSDGNGSSIAVASVASPAAGAVAEVSLPVAVPVDSASPAGSAGVADVRQGELLSEARAAEARGDDLEAIGHYMTAMRSYPDNAEVKAAVTAYIESLAGRPPDVIGFLDRALVECAEELGIGAAMRLLGDRAMTGEHWDDAYHWLSKAAIEQDVPGTRLLGLLLATGRGAARDLEAAAECFEWAANKGDLGASYLAGECYVLGKGVEKDPARGIVFLEAAAAAGDLRAVDLMGVCHAHGLGTEINYEKALACFREAVEGGYPAALANLGVLYIQGQGVKQNAETAVEYFREGAEVNNATCMFYYAKCFEKGLGVEESRVSAVEWYGRAAAAGNADARAWFAALGEEDHH